MQGRFPSGQRDGQSHRAGEPEEFPHERSVTWAGQHPGFRLVQRSGGRVQRSEVRALGACWPTCAPATCALQLSTHGASTRKYRLLRVADIDA